MKLKLLVAAATVAVFGVGAAIAAGEPQAVRKDMMKQTGGAMGALSAIAKGEKPFDAAVVQASLTKLSEIGKAFPDQFPAGSETGMDTKASPKIWEDMDGFKAESAKLAAAADAQLASMPTDQAGVGAALKSISGTCGECHQTYRLR